MSIRWKRTRMNRFVVAEHERRLPWTRQTALDEDSSQAHVDT